MNQMNNGWNENETETQTPAELRAVAGAMDRLGERERASAPAGLEDRLFAATRASLVEGPAVIARIDAGSSNAGGLNGWRFRLAASIMIAAVGVVAAVWVNSHGAVSSPVANGVPGSGINVASSVSSAELAKQLENDLSAWASETSAIASSDTELAALHSSLTEIESGGVSDPWDVIDVGTEEPSL
jgi:hypothetical protein